MINIVVPSTYNGGNVTRIGDGAFSDSIKLMCDYTRWRNEHRSRCVCLTSHEHFLVVKTIVLSSDFNKNR